MIEKLTKKQIFLLFISTAILLKIAYEYDIMTFIFLATISLLGLVFLFNKESKNKYGKAKYICKNCYEKFNTPNETRSGLGIAWIIFIFISMGLGLILWFFMREKTKYVCPYCNSTSIISINSTAGKILLADIASKTQSAS